MGNLLGAKHHSPKKHKTENKELAKDILKYFFENGLVKFYIDIFGKEGELKPIDFDEALKMLDQEEYWAPPALNTTYLAVGSTEKGEKFYNERLFDTL